MRDGIQVNRNKIIRPVVLPSELMTLKAGEGYISFAGFKPAKFKFADQSFQKISSPYDENLELLELFAKELEIGEKRRKEIESTILMNQDNNINNNTTNNKVIKKAAKPSNKEIITEEKLSKPIRKEDLSVMNF
jgi:hypothetical protein